MLRQRTVRNRRLGQARINKHHLTPNIVAEITKKVGQSGQVLLEAAVILPTLLDPCSRNQPFVCVSILTEDATVCCEHKQGV